MRGKHVMLAGGLVAALVLVVLASRATGLADWEQHHLGGAFLTSLVTCFVLPVGVLAATLTPTTAGLSASQPSRWLEIGCMALGVLGPLGGMAFAAGVPSDPRRSSTGLIIAAAYALGLPAMAWFLRRTRRVDAEAHPLTPLALVGLAIGAAALAVVLSPRSTVATEVLYLLVLVGLGEELLFRGAVQSLLDRAWGTPWRIGGAAVGWGWVAQAVAFGLVHPLVAAQPGLWVWGVWTAAAGLCFGWLRARSGTILAPALVHGTTDVIGLVVVPLLAA